MYWNAGDHIPDLSGCTIIITGCTSGVGLEAARQLLDLNATIVMACRSAEKMRQVTETLSKDQKARLHQLELDVSDFDSVKAFPTALDSATITTVDVVILNAGIAANAWFLSPQGLELTFATNVVGHWLLVGLLVPYLAKSTSPRIVALSSVMHFFINRVDYDAISGTTPPRVDASHTRYRESKLAQHWLVAQFNRRLRNKLPTLVAVAVHPGYAQTEMTNARSSSNEGSLFAQFVLSVFSPLKQTASQGAWPIVLAAGSPDALPDQYYGPSGFLELWGTPCSNARRASVATDVEKQEELWNFCEQTTQFTYP